MAKSLCRDANDFVPHFASSKKMFSTHKHMDTIALIRTNVNRQLAAMSLELKWTTEQDHSHHMFIEMRVSFCYNKIYERKSLCEIWIYYWIIVYAEICVQIRQFSFHSIALSFFRTQRSRPNKRWSDSSAFFVSLLPMNQMTGASSSAAAAAGKRVIKEDEQKKRQTNKLYGWFPMFKNKSIQIFPMIRVEPEIFHNTRSRRIAGQFKTIFTTIKKTSKIKTFNNQKFEKFKTKPFK